MNYKLEIRPRFEGLENKRELEEVVRQLALEGLAVSASMEFMSTFAKANNMMAEAFRESGEF